MGRSEAFLLLGVVLGVQHNYGRCAGQVISFNRSVGVVEVGTCEGLKKNAELGIDIAIVVTANLRCSETITLPSAVDVSIGSALEENFVVAIAEDFAVPDPTSASLLVNPEGSYLSLDQLTFANEANTLGAPGAVRAVFNAGQLDVSGCVFESLNYASQQDGGGIYSTADPESPSGASVSVRNSTFIGNVAESYGGAISSWGRGEVEVSNCTFLGNEAVGIGDYRRAGSGGAVYASAGVFVTVLNSSFESCLGRYGGSALFACGADIYESTFNGNEATGVFGAVVNGDLSDEERADATLSFGVQGQNYTCPPLYVTRTMFMGNVAGTGYGGAIASVDSSLRVDISSFKDTVGGAIYFGTSDDNGRDQLELDLIQFNVNDGSASSPDFVGAAFVVEKTGSPASNTTGAVEEVEPPAASYSSLATASLGSLGVASTKAAADAGSNFIGFANDIYCFQNEPYDCEVYFGASGDDEIAVQLTGTVRCSACKGGSFTGIGSAEGVPTPAPSTFEEDDDGLSQMGQERAQGGTPAPAGLGESSSDLDLGEESEPELFGVTGGMRWIVIGLIAGLGFALLVCMCLLTVCRTREKKRVKEALSQLELVDEDPEESKPRGGAVVVVPPMAASAVAGEKDEGVLGRSTGEGGDGGSKPDLYYAVPHKTSAAAIVDADSSGRSIGADLPRAVSRRPSGNTDSSRPSSRRPSGNTDPSRSSSRRPSGNTDPSRPSSRRPSGNTDPSRPSSRRPSGNTEPSQPSSRRPSGRSERGAVSDPHGNTNGSAVAVVNVPTASASELKEQELARQRTLERAAASESEGDEWGSPKHVRAWGEGVVGGAGHVALSTRSTPTKRGFTALPDDPVDLEEEKQQARGRRPSKNRGIRSRRGQSPPGAHNDSGAEAAAAAGRVVVAGGTTQQERSRSRTTPSLTSSRQRSTDRALARAVKTPAGGARMPIDGSSPYRAERRGRSSGKILADVAGAATELEAAAPARGQKQPPSFAVNENPVYSHGGGGGSSNNNRSRSPTRGEVKALDGKSRSMPKSRGGDNRERGEAARGRGWAPDLYRNSTTPKKSKSARVHNGKFDSSRSDWSGDGEVEWSRHMDMK